jgi:hypothetical protein
MRCTKKIVQHFIIVYLVYGKQCHLSKFIFKVIVLLVCKPCMILVVRKRLVIFVYYTLVFSSFFFSLIFNLSNQLSYNCFYKSNIISVIKVLFRFFYIAIKLCKSLSFCFKKISASLYFIILLILLSTTQLCYKITVLCKIYANLLIHAAIIRKVTRIKLRHNNAHFSLLHQVVYRVYQRIDVLFFVIFRKLVIHRYTGNKFCKLIILFLIFPAILRFYSLFLGSILY